MSMGVSGWRSVRGAGRRGSGGRCAGFSIIEVSLAIMLVTLSVGAVTSAMATTKSLSRSNTDRALALDAAQSVIERMRAIEPSEVFARFNANPLDDLSLDDPGNLFQVRGLTVRRDDADGFVGEITFPGDGTVLREDLDDVELGMQRDLNGDAVIDANDHAADYTILPVRVRVEWLGTGGPQSLEIVFVISGR